MNSAQAISAAARAEPTAALSTGELTELLSAVRQLQAEHAGALQVLRRLEQRFSGLGDRHAAEAAAEGAAGALWHDALDRPARVHRLQVQVLGPFRAWLDGRPIDNWQNRRARTLLKCLAVNERQRAPREQLIEALWPGADPRAGANSLRVTIHALRRILAEAAGEAGADDLLLCEGDGYGFGPSLAVDVDVISFERLWQRGRRLEQEEAPERALAAFEAAEALYQGDFLQDDPYDEWTVLRREALRDCYLALLARLGRRSLERGDYEGCIQRCQRLLRQDPCREDIYQWLMRCHAALGQPGRVRRWFDVCTAVLRQELDLPPGPETVALLHALRASPATINSALTPD